MMSNVTFTKEDFSIFEIPTLEDRMQAIREQIQPKFREFGELFKEGLLNEMDEDELFVHVAQHLRRTKNPPNDTWMAVSCNKRGYKMAPHFQLGLYGDHVFIWLAFIDNPKFEKEMAQGLLDKIELFETLPEDFVVSLDHHTTKVTPIKELDIEKGLTRFRDVKKGEFLVGRQLMADDSILKNPAATQMYMLNTFKKLLPLYKQSFQSIPTEY
ncbi:conserved hypothetical protein [Carnobacterium divergens]|nr:conserved hypothetical protein [Carnobacterium divergens]